MFVERRTRTLSMLSTCISTSIAPPLTVIPAATPELAAADGIAPGGRSRARFRRLVVFTGKLS
jgi:hypothetical protein